MKKYMSFLTGTVLLTMADQVTKFLAVKYLKGTPGIVVVPGVFELSYLENPGAAWGMLSGMHWIFYIFTVLLLIGILFCLKRMPNTKQYQPFQILSMVLAAGSIGNAIDRLFRGYVVDFFYIRLIDFPVFNVADCFICVSLVLLLFIYRNEEFTWMKK